MPIEMHSTVPESVRSIISSPELLNKLTAGRPEIGIRLVSTSYPDMRSVWARVCQHEDPEVPGFFFSCAAELPATWRNMVKIPTKVLEKDVAKIATAAEELAVLLETEPPRIFRRLAGLSQAAMASSDVD